MKKSFQLKFAGVEFKITAFCLFFMFFSYLFGVVLSFFIDLQISDKLFSPFVMIHQGLLNEIIFHSLLYYFLFIAVGFILATSYFGFVFFPLLVLLKGLFSALTIKSLFLVNSYYYAFIFAGILLTIEVGIILLYFSCSMLTSFNFFISKGQEPEFQASLKQFSVSAVMMLLLACACSLIQYLYL